VIALGALAQEVSHLDALIVFRLSDARVHAAWVREGAEFEASDIAPKLREAYRASEAALWGMGWAMSASVDAPADPQLLVEASSGCCVVRRVGDSAAAIVFGPAMPLGMARLVASRIVEKLSSEPAHFGSAEPLEAPRAPSEALARTSASSSPAAAPAPSRSLDAERVERLLANLEAHAAEPHVARLRVALKAGLTTLALERPDALRPEAMVLIETAVEELLGASPSDVRRLG
jgi:predicted regulator of Ras-like GTPase activity (Roadblock/LC7/MglB family)